MGNITANVGRSQQRAAIQAITYHLLKVAVSHVDLGEDRCPFGGQGVCSTGPQSSSMVGMGSREEWVGAERGGACLCWVFGSLWPL